MNLDGLGYGNDWENWKPRNGLIDGHIHGLVGHNFSHLHL